MSQIGRIEKVLLANNEYPGLTAAQVAKKAGVSRSTVYKRVSDLRNLHGMRIYSNTRKVNGHTKTYYRAA